MDGVTLNSNVIQLSTNDIRAITYTDSQLKIIAQINDEIVAVSVTKSYLRQLFPNIAKLRSGELGLVSFDQSCFVPIDESNDALIKAINIPPSQIDSLEQSAKDDTCYKLVKNAGLQEEYCLLFSGHIIFHCETEAEMKTYKNAHPGLCFTEYYPQL
jgi:hypothetical protein